MSMMNAPAPERVDLSKYIETRLMENHPHLWDRRIPVAVIVCQARANRWSIEETAWNFSLSEAEVLAALLYYQEHKEEIDHQEAEETRFAEQMKRQHGKG